MTLARVAAGSWVVSKASLVGSEARLLVVAALSFKVVWFLCQSLAAWGVLTVVAHTHTPLTSTHSLFTPLLTHTLFLTAAMPAAISLKVYICSNVLYTNSKI